MHVADILAAIPLARDSGQPLFRQVYGGIKERILNGKLHPGTQLPPTRDFAQLLKVSRQTVLAAYDQLMAEGYLRGHVGKGTFVAEDLPAPASATSGTTLLRPLSARGSRYAEAMGQTTWHRGPVRAFRTGMPGLDLFPFDVWKRLEARHWRQADWQFGYSDPAGYMPLRELLCAYLKAARGVHCSPGQILITSGSQQALYLLSTVLLDAGDAVWVESPGYRGATAPLQAGGARLFSVPVDAQGLDVAFGAARCPGARLVFVTPSHQLPLGVTMSLPRRLELLQWAAAQRAWILEDDYDSEYRHTGPPLASLQSLDRAGCVVYVGTLSKVLFPGLRLGYVVAPPALIEPLVRAKSVIDRHTAIVPQRTLADFISAGHFARHIKRTRDAYGERREAVLDALNASLGAHARIGPADAGLDLCLHLPSEASEAALVQSGLAHGLELRGLGHYTDASADPACAIGPGLLLGYAAVPPPALRQAVKTLASLILTA